MKKKKKTPVYKSQDKLNREFSVYAMTLIDAARVMVTRDGPTSVAKASKVLDTLEEALPVLRQIVQDMKDAGAEPKEEPKEESQKKGRERCKECAGMGQFITHVVNGKPTGPGGICFRCNGKGFQTDADRKRNWGYDMYGRKA